MSGPRLTEQQQAIRNQNPHAEARFAMVYWSHKYAHEQRGGSMDFWDSLSDQDKRFCVSAVTDILNAEKKSGRAAVTRLSPRREG